MQPALTTSTSATVESGKTWEIKLGEKELIEGERYYQLYHLLLRFYYTLEASVCSLSPDELPYQRFSQMRTVYITIEIEETLSQLLRIPVTILKPEDVRNYLIRYYDIIDLLPFVCEITRERFGLDTQLSLEVYHDPEAEDEYLTLYVRQQKYDEDIMKKIEEVWAIYENMLSDKDGWLLVTTDFRPPR